MTFIAQTLMLLPSFSRLSFSVLIQALWMWMTDCMRLLDRGESKYSPRKGPINKTKGPSSTQTWNWVRHTFLRCYSVSESFYSSRLMTHNGFTRIDSNQLTNQSRFLKFDSNRLMTQKASRFFIQINSRLNKLFRILIRINSWLNDVIHSLFVWPLWAFNLTADLVWTYWGFPLKFWLRMTFLAIRLKWLPDKLIWIISWLKQYLGDLNRFNSWLKWIQRHWFKSTHDSKCFPILDSNQLMSQVKNILFWVDSWFDFALYPCLPTRPAPIIKTSRNQATIFPKGYF